MYFCVAYEEYRKQRCLQFLTTSTPLYTLIQGHVMTGTGLHGAGIITTLATKHTRWIQDDSHLKPTSPIRITAQGLSAYLNTACPVVSFLRLRLMAPRILHRATIPRLPLARE